MSKFTRVSYLDSPINTFIDKLSDDYKNNFTGGFSLKLLHQNYTEPIVSIRKGSGNQAVYADFYSNNTEELYTLYKNNSYVDILSNIPATSEQITRSLGTYIDSGENLLWYSNKGFNSTNGNTLNTTGTMIDNIVNYGEWIQFDLLNTTIIKQFSINTIWSISYESANADKHSPRNFVLCGSNDTNTWYNIYEGVNIKWLPKGEIKLFNTKDNNNAYRYYRLLVKRVGNYDSISTNINMQDSININNIQLFKNDSSFRGKISLSEWLNGEDGYVNIWYNQTNRSRLVQNIETLQPKINNGNSLYFDGTKYLKIDDSVPVITSSSSKKLKNEPFMAFNDTKSDYWISNTTYNTLGNYIGNINTTVSNVVYSGEWLQISLQEPVSISSFELEANVPNINPVLPTGIIGQYTADSFNSTSWTDLSTSGNHVTSITEGSNIITQTVGNISYLSGSQKTRLQFPNQILQSDYTLFHVAKYNGANKNRIFDSASRPPGTLVNWLSGFLFSQTGIAYDYSLPGGYITQNSSKHEINSWVFSTHSNISMYRSQGVDRTTNTSASTLFPILTINAGYYSYYGGGGTENSDWAIAEIIVYNKKLSVDEMKRVETYLFDKYSVLQDSGINTVVYSNEYPKNYFTEYISPKNFILAGSNTGQTWDLVYSGNDQTKWYAEESKKYQLTNVSNKYKFYRLIITNVDNSQKNLPTSAAIKNWRIYKKDSNFNIIPNMNNNYIKFANIFDTSNKEFSVISNWENSSLSNNVQYIYKNNNYLLNTIENLLSNNNQYFSLAQRGNTYSLECFDNNTNLSSLNVDLNNNISIISCNKKDGDLINITHNINGFKKTSNVQVSKNSSSYNDEMTLGENFVGNISELITFKKQLNDRETSKYLSDNKHDIDNERILSLIKPNIWLEFKKTDTNEINNTNIDNSKNGDLIGFPGVISNSNMIPHIGLTSASIISSDITYTVTQSSQIGANLAWKAFDRTTGYWESSSIFNVSTGNYESDTSNTVGGGVYFGIYIELQSSKPFIAQYMSIKPTSTFKAPAKFILAGKINNETTNWSLLHIEQNISKWENNKTKFFNISNPGFYTNYKLIIEKTYRSPALESIGNLPLPCEIQELQFYTSNDITNNIIKLDPEQNIILSSFPIPHVAFSTGTINLPSSDTTYIVTSSSINSTNYAWKAFDITTGYWESSLNYNTNGNYTGSVSTTVGNLSPMVVSGEWIQIYSSSKPKINSVTILPNDTGLNNTPKSIVIVGSNNNSDWFEIHSESNITGWTTGQTKTFNLTYPSYWFTTRLIIKENNGSNSIQLSEIQFLAKDLTNLTPRISKWNDYNYLTSSYIVSLTSQPKYYSSGGYNNKSYIEFTSGTGLISSGKKTFNVETNNGFTAVCLVKLLGNTDTGYDKIFDFYQYNNSTIGNISLSRITGTRNMNFFVSSNSTVGNFSLTQGSLITKNEWSFYTIRYNSINRNIQLFKNNNLIKTDTIPVNIFTNNTYETSYIANNSINTISNLQLGGLYIEDRYISDGELLDIHKYFGFNMVPNINLDISTINQLDSTQIFKWGDLYNSASFKPIYHISNGYTNGLLSESSSRVTFSFGQQNYLEGVTKDYKISTNGGLTIIFFAKFTNYNNTEFILDIGQLENDCIQIYRNGQQSLQITIKNNISAVISLLITGIIEIDKWNVYSIQINNDTKNLQVYKNSILVNNSTYTTSITDKLYSNYPNLVHTWVGRGYLNASDIYSNFDLAGLYVYDKCLNSTELRSIENTVRLSNELYPLPKIELENFLLDKSITNVTIGNWNGYTQSNISAPTYYNYGGYNDLPYINFSRGNSNTDNDNKWLSGGRKPLYISKNGGFTSISQFRLTGSAGNNERIYEIGNKANDNDIVSLYRNGSDNSLYYLIKNDTIEALKINVSNINQDQWYNMVFRYSIRNPSFAKCEIWNNGNLIVNNTYGSNIITDKTYFSGGNSYIGRPTVTNGSDTYLNGDIGSIYIYDKALSDKELSSVSSKLFTNNFNTQDAQTKYITNGFVTYEPFGNGKMNSVKITNTIGNLSHNYLQINDVPQFPITYCFWCKPDYNQYGQVVSLADSYKLPGGLYIGLTTSGNYQLLLFNSNTITTIGSTSYIPNTWTHLAVTISESGNVNFYKNILNQNVNITTLPDKSSCLYIGSSGYDSTSYFNGSIADFRVYNKILTVSELQSIYYEIYDNLNESNVKLSKTNFTLNKNNWINNISLTSTSGNYTITSTIGSYSVEKQSNITLNTTGNLYYTLLNQTEKMNDFQISFDCKFYCKIQLDIDDNSLEFSSLNKNTRLITDNQTFIKSKSWDKNIWYNICIIYKKNKNIKILVNDQLQLNEYLNTTQNKTVSSKLTLKFLSEYTVQNNTINLKNVEFIKNNNFQLQNVIFNEGINLLPTITNKKYPIGTIGSVVSSSSILSTHLPQYAFDNYIRVTTGILVGDLGEGFWHSGLNYTTTVSAGIYNGNASTTIGNTNYGGEWLQIQLPEKIKTEYFSITPRLTSEVVAQIRSPRSFILAGSTNGNTWVGIYSAANVKDWTTNSKTFSVYNSDYYDYYRLVIREIGNDGTYGSLKDSVQISDLSFYTSQIKLSENLEKSFGLLDGLTTRVYNTKLTTETEFLENQYVKIDRTTDLIFLTTGSINSELNVFSIKWSGLFRPDETGYWNFNYGISSNSDYGFILVGNVTNTVGNVTNTVGNKQYLISGNYYDISVSYGTNQTSANTKLTITSPSNKIITNATGYMFTPIGKDSKFPAENAKIVKELTNTNKDGIYYISCNGVSKPTYCLMDDKYDGGGWMLLMKGNNGSTFSYLSNYWTSNLTTLNTNDLTLNNNNAKYDVFNSVRIKDIMAIFLDIDPTKYTNINGERGGTLQLDEGWCWKLNNWYNNKIISPHTGFNIPREITTQPFDFSGFSKNLFSYQTGSYKHTIGGLPGLTWNLYPGYFNDNINFFNTSSPIAYGTSNNFTSLETATNNQILSNITSNSTYSIQWTGWFKPDLTGTWSFSTTSDDASFLWLGNVTNDTQGALVKNGGQHGLLTTRANISLVANTFYPIKIAFGDAGGADSFTMSFTSPNNIGSSNGLGYFFSSNCFTRWGTIFNEQINDLSSIDTFFGIGTMIKIANNNLITANLSAGDYYYCCGVKGFNNTTSFRLFGR